MPTAGAPLATPWLKPLPRKRIWLALWFLAIIILVVVCLLPAPDLPKVGLNDKLEHALAFAVLSASAVQLFVRGRVLATVAIGLLALGIGIEFAQGAFTTTRAMERADVIADAIGICAGMLVAWTPLRDVLLHIDRRT